MTCKDCIHFEACKNILEAVNPDYKGKNITVESVCEVFKNKSDFVEVVRCKGCAHYIKMEGFDYNGRKARSCVWHCALRGENDYCSDAIRTSKRTPEERGGEK